MKQSDFSAPITADDVAELAGVSRWTVGRAFRKEASISEKSRKKVLDAAKELGYSPDLLATSLASHQTNLVSLLIDDFSNPYKVVVIERLARLLRQNGWDTLLVNTLNEQDASAALLSASQRRVDAAVLIGSNFNDHNLTAALGSRRVNKLIVFARYSANPDAISLCCDDRDAMKTIANYALGRGYKRAAYLAGPQTDTAHVLRMETFLRHWHAATGVEPAVAVVGGYDQQRAYPAAISLLDRLAPDQLPDVIVGESDALAMGAIDAIRYKYRLRVPEDIAVIGFDDVPLASSTQYRLTTYRQPVDHMGEALLSVLKGDDITAPLTQFVGELVIRDSA